MAANEKLIPIVTVLITLSALPGLSRNDGRRKLMTTERKINATVTTETTYSASYRDLGGFAGEF